MFSDLSRDENIPRLASWKGRKIMIGGAFFFPNKVSSFLNFDRSVFPLFEMLKNRKFEVVF